MTIPTLQPNLHMVTFLHRLKIRVQPLHNDKGMDFYIFRSKSRTSVKLHVSLIKYYTLSWVGLALGIATTKWKIIVDKIEVRK